MLNVTTEEVGITSTAKKTSTSSPFISSSLVPPAAPAPTTSNNPARTTDTTKNNNTTISHQTTKPTLPRPSSPPPPPLPPQSLFRGSCPNNKNILHPNLAGISTNTIEQQSTHENPENEDDPVVVLQELHDIATESTIPRKARMHHHQPLDMCLEHNGNKMVIPSASGGTGSPPSPSTIPTTTIEAPLAGASSEASNSKAFGANHMHNKNNNSHIVHGDMTESSTVAVGGGESPRSPISTIEVPLPEELLRQQPPPHTSQQPSILRKGRYSPAATTIATATFGSPTPSTGQRVRGLWSPSIELFGEDDEDRTTTTTTDGRLPAPALPLSEAESSPSSPFDALRHQTLSHIFCYLPLADLLRAGMVSRRWRHEIHHTGNGNANANINGGVGNTGKKGSGTRREGAGEGKGTDRGNRSFVFESSGVLQQQQQHLSEHHHHHHQLWERVDASSFIQETYDRFLETAHRKIREQEEQQEQKQEQRDQPSAEGIPSPSPAPPGHEGEPSATATATTLSKPQHSKTKRKPRTKKNKKITDPARWARLQTGRALGNVLRSKTTATGRKPFAIRSLILREVGTKLCSNHLDDFLPSTVLSSLRELTLEGFGSLTDTHVHVLLLTTLPSAAKFRNNPGRGGSSRLEALALENCPGLSNKTLSSIAKTCSLRRLSVRGCPGIDSIEALSDLLITKLVLPQSDSGDEETAATTTASPIQAGLSPTTINTTKQHLAAERAATPSTVLSSLEPSPLPADPSWFEEEVSSSGPTAEGLATRQHPPTHQPTDAPSSKPAGLSSLFAPSLSLQVKQKQEPRETTATSLRAKPPPLPLDSLFAPPQTRDVPPKPPKGLGSLFAPPPPKPSTNTKAASNNKDLASLFAPPPTKKQQEPSSTTTNKNKLVPNGLGSLFAPPPPTKKEELLSTNKNKPAPNGLGSLFAPPPPTKKEEPVSITNKNKQTPNGLGSLFAPPPSKKQELPTNNNPISNGLGSLFAPPPTKKQELSTTNKQAPNGLGSLFAPPLPPAQKPKRLSSGDRCLSSSSSTSKSSLASLFDLPGTSPTRRNNAESMRILPPPPPPLAIPGPSPSPKLQQQHQQQQQQHPLQRSNAGPNQHQYHRRGNTFPSTTAVSKRYHRHQRSLSNGKLPFPSALLPLASCDLDGIFHESNGNSNHNAPAIPATIGTRNSSSNSITSTINSNSSNNNNAYAPAIVVGSLGILDIRGTAVTPSSLVSCLWALTHHDGGGGTTATIAATTATGQDLQQQQQQQQHQKRLWCKVWFEALHLGRSDAAAGPEGEDQESSTTSSNHQTHHSWTNEVLAHLETVLAMDEMERSSRTSSSSSSSSSSSNNKNKNSNGIEEISYFSSQP